MRPRLHSALWFPVISKNTFSVFGKGERFFSFLQSLDRPIGSHDFVTSGYPGTFIRSLQNRTFTPPLGLRGLSWGTLSPANHHFIPVIYLTVCEFSSVGLTHCLSNQQTRSMWPIDWFPVSCMFSRLTDFMPGPLLQHNGRVCSRVGGPASDTRGCSVPHIHTTTEQ